MENEETTVPETEPTTTSEVRVVDKRRFARLLGFGSGDADPAANSSRRAERAEALARAEIEAARGRLERYYDAQLAQARSEIVVALLDVYDNLERALGAPGATESPLHEGVAATRDLFLRRLAELGVEPVLAAGEPFDPQLHEAVEQEPVDDPELDGRVVAELARGFRCGDRLVRPAAVRVGRAAETQNRER